MGEVLQFIATFGACAAAVAAWLAARASTKQAVIAERMWRESSDPRVVAYLRPSSRGASFPEIILENVGRGHAYSVVVETNHSHATKALGSKLAACLSTKRPVIAAGQSLVFDAALSHKWDQDIEVVAHYARNPESTRELQTRSVLSLAVPTGVGLEVNADPLRLMHAAIRSIDEKIGVIAKTLRGGGQA